ncbi:DUF4234 domain-containing protein [Shewanella mangrovisoli]|uniref:DUF4234 domain-containing protein n=1 Tax=Shewanella mangrovisoli TaxID=2864211 RepID=UPI001C65B906|nr:DUF4234 domain-containing protein [Shewanella mangrovisoli]QYK08462.1 DUF4234 domain-containing protein [Shewanella mangrovisoli]
MAFVKSTRRFKPKFLQAYDVQKDLQINHGMHFVLTLITFGLWGLVWWYLILKSQGDNQSLFSGFDDDYWSYLIECEQPPASLYRQRFAASVNSVQFEA